MGTVEDVMPEHVAALLKETAEGGGCDAFPLGNRVKRLGGEPPRAI